MTHIKNAVTIFTIILLICLGTFVFFVSFGTDIGGTQSEIKPEAQNPYTPQPIPETIFCAADVRECSDGSFVGRNPPTCEFTKCKTSPPQKPQPPIEEQVVCTMDAKMCPDGSYVGRTGPKCEFAPCP